MTEKPYAVIYTPDGQVQRTMTEFKPSEWFAENCFDPDERPFIKVHGWLCGDEDFHELEMSDLDQILANGGEYVGVAEYHVFQRDGAFMLVPKYQLDARKTDD